MPIDQIKPNARNVRRDLGDVTELADSIREVGVLQPCTVAPSTTDPVQCPECDTLFPVDQLVGGAFPRHWRSPQSRRNCRAGTEAAPITYDLIAGHRRLAASVQAGHTHLPCVIRADLTGVVDVTVAMLSENLHRADLSPMEEATAYAQLQIAGLDEQTIARRTGRSRTTVASRLKLMDLPDRMQARVHERQITLDEAAALAEFAGDPGALRELEQAAGTRDWPHALRRMRDSRETRLERERMVADFAARGFRVLDSGETSGLWEQTLRSLDISEDDHAPCAGRAVHVTPTNFVQNYCLEPWLHAPDRFPDPAAPTYDTTAPAAGGDTTAATQPALPTVAQQDAEAQERRAAEQAEAAAAAKAAFAVRQEFLETFCRDRRPVPADQGAAVLRHLLDLLTRAYLGEVVMQDWLHILTGEDVADVDDDAAETKVRAIVAERDPIRVLLAELAVESDRLVYPAHWGPSPLGSHLPFLQSLIAVGYVPSTWEQERIDAALAYRTRVESPAVVDVRLPEHDVPADVDQADSDDEATSGTCRVCFCTDDEACDPPCSWADAEHTICTACTAG
jgi:ParB family chromosome partitioning protein